MQDRRSRPVCLPARQAGQTHQSESFQRRGLPIPSDREMGTGAARNRPGLLCPTRKQYPGHRPVVQPIPKGKQNGVLHPFQRSSTQRVYAPTGRNLEPSEERFYLPGLRQGAGDARSRHFRLGKGGRLVFSAGKLPQPPLPFLRRFPLDSPESRRPDAKTNPVGAHRRVRLCPPPVCLSGGRNL